MRATPAKAGLVAGLVLVAGLATGGCMGVPAYAPMDSKGAGGFGFTDSPSGDGGHIIRVYLPSYIADPQLPYAWFERRAGELCNGQATRKSVHTAVRQTVLYDSHGGMPGNYFLEGYAYCAPPSGTPPSPASEPAPALP